MGRKTQNDDTLQILEQVVAGMQEKKAKQIVSLDLSKIPNAVSQHFVICHAPSKIQVDAIYDGVLELCKSIAVLNLSIEKVMKTRNGF